MNLRKSTEVPEMSSMETVVTVVLVASMVASMVGVVTMVLVAAAISSCEATQEARGVTIVVSSVTPVVMAGVVAVSSIPSVEVTHIIPGGEEWSKPGTRIP